VNAHKISIDDDLGKDYSLIGISCHLKDYRLVYNINKTLECDLKKYNDLIIYPVKGKKKNSYSFYHCQDDYLEINIISNRNPNGVLITEHKQIDYILLLRGQNISKPKKLIIKSVLQIPSVLTSFEIDINSIKNVDIIFSDLELHLMEIHRIIKAEE